MIRKAVVFWITCHMKAKKGQEDDESLIAVYSNYARDFIYISIKENDLY